MADSNGPTTVQSAPAVEPNAMHAPSPYVCGVHTNFAYAARVWQAPTARACMHATRTHARTWSTLVRKHAKARNRTNTDANSFMHTVVGRESGTLKEDGDERAESSTDRYREGDGCLG